VTRVPLSISSSVVQGALGQGARSLPACLPDAFRNAPSPPSAPALAPTTDIDRAVPPPGDHPVALISQQGTRATELVGGRALPTRR